VRNGTHLHLGAVELEVGVPHVMEADVAEQVLGGDGEERRAHELVERFTEAAGVLLRWAVDVEAGAGLQDGGEEGQALDVVPVDVRDEGGTDERRRGIERLAPEAQAGAEIEDDRFMAGGLESDARRVAAVAAIGVTWTRRGSPDAEEADVEQRSPLPEVSGTLPAPCQPV